MYLIYVSTTLIYELYPGVDMDPALFKKFIELIGQFWKSKENAPFSKLHVQSKFNGIEKN